MYVEPQTFASTTAFDVGKKSIGLLVFQRRHGQKLGFDPEGGRPGRQQTIRRIVPGLMQLNSTASVGDRDPTCPVPIGRPIILAIDRDVCIRRLDNNLKGTLILRERWGIPYPPDCTPTTSEAKDGNGKYCAGPFG